MDVFIAILAVTFIYLFITTLFRDRFRNVPYTPWLLYVVHLVMSASYMAFTYKSSSDSYKYFKDSSRSETWLTLYETGTSFVSFLAWPFTRFLEIGYYPTMVVFSFLGLLGLFLTYVAGKEQMRNQAAGFWGLGLLEWTFLLPNSHFWSASLGKGSLMIFGLGLSFWGLSRINRRVIPFVIGLFIVYSIRPHIFLAVVVAIIAGMIFSTSGIRNYLRVTLIILSLLTFYITSDSISEFANVESVNILSDETASDLQQRAESLSRAKSGVDINNYSLPMKLYTFWFRPSLLDISSFIAFISAMENTFLMLFLIYFLRPIWFSWKNWNGWFKIMLFFFLFASLALSQITGNLGIAMRQKAQIMPFFLIVICNAISLYQSVTVRPQPLRTINS